jgi:1,5-anhydro-D-fructose reductase (1,5-anhydro-D-mannitol-forming)
MAKVNWLLVGAGDIAAKRVASALASANDSQLVAICDLNKDRALNIAQKLRIPEVYTDFSHALNSDKIDAVYLATPIHLHGSQAIQSIAAGKHTLVEKPMCINVREGRMLVEAAEHSDVKVGCAYYRRLYPAFAYTKDMFDTGAFGQLVLGNMQYHSWFNPKPDDPKYWRVVQAKSGGGPLSDMGSHMFDILIGLIGLPESVYAHTANLHTGWDVEDTAALVLNMSDGSLVTASFSWHSKTWQHHFELVGADAKIVWMPFDSGNVVKTVGRSVETLTLPPAANVHQPLVDNFIQAVLHGKELACPVIEAFKADLLLEAIYRSARQKREVFLSEIDLS